MRKPIYDSSPQDKLKDLLEAVLMAQKILAMDLSRYSTNEEQYREGLTEGEFAIGNWIVRPRFPHDDTHVIVGQSIDGERPVTECSASEQMSEHTPTREMANPFKPCPS